MLNNQNPPETGRGGSGGGRGGDVGSHNVNTTNSNYGLGTFNHVSGNQSVRTTNTHHGPASYGDSYSGPITGSNVGGQNNHNTVNNAAAFASDGERRMTRRAAS